MRLPVKQDLIFPDYSLNLSNLGMPGQVAMASLYAGGSSPFVIFTAVALANLRMMLMSISGADMLGLNRQDMPFLKRLFYIQFLAISGWAQLTYREAQYSKAELRQYYIGFTVILFIMALGGTMIGFMLEVWCLRLSSL